MDDASFVAVKRFSTREFFDLGRAIGLNIKTLRGMKDIIWGQVDGTLPTFDERGRILQVYLLYALGIKIDYFEVFPELHAVLREIAFAHNSHMKEFDDYPASLGAITDQVFSPEWLTTSSSRISGLALSKFQSALVAIDLLDGSSLTWALTCELRDVFSDLDLPYGIKTPDPNEVLTALSVADYLADRPSTQQMLAGLSRLMRALETFNEICPDQSVDLAPDVSLIKLSVGQILSWSLNLSNRKVSERLSALLTVFAKMLEATQKKQKDLPSWTSATMISKWLELFSFWGSFTGESTFSVGLRSDILASGATTSEYERITGDNPEY